MRGRGWTFSADLRMQVQKLWDKGSLLACIVNHKDEELLFPKRLMLKGPTSADLSNQFEHVRFWIADLLRGAIHYRLVMRDVNHRVLGQNALPDEVWVDHLEQALVWIGKGKEAKRFAKIVEMTRLRQPDLLPWIEQRPLKALELAEDWSRLLDIVTWLHMHPRPGIYMRQVDIPNIHSKFIEGYRHVLAEWFDRVLPVTYINTALSGASKFCSRYGFLDKPLRIRFRLLDTDLSWLPKGVDQDITLNQEAFNQLNPPVCRVFMTENEINFLSFPPLAGSMVIFGAGYGFDVLKEAVWLKQCSIYYWGDIDTHGFAILDQLRASFPHVYSFLMDRETLLAHQKQWVEEPQLVTRNLTRLLPKESALFEDLRIQRLGVKVRLEQERIGFQWVRDALQVYC